MTSDFGGKAVSHKYTWEELYRAAILETNDTLLGQRIDAAEAAIGARLNELALNGHASGEERCAIRDALNGLRVVRSERQRPN
jgi:hypothetical protein